MSVDGFTTAPAHEALRLPEGTRLGECPACKEQYVALEDGAARCVDNEDGPYSCNAVFDVALIVHLTKRETAGDDRRSS